MTEHQIKPGEEYRAVVEDIEFRQFLIAKGSYSFVAHQLELWLSENELVPGQTALITHVVKTVTGPEFPIVVFGETVN